MDRCECGNRACPSCHGQCCRWAVMTLYRVDMQDEGGTAMCDGCGEDALESGLFATRDDDEDDDADAP